MSALRLSRAALGVIAALVLAGCGGQVAPTSGVPQSLAPTNATRGKSWILPEAKGENLLYISDPASGGVLIFTYNPPSTPKSVGALLGLPAPAGMCVDKEQNIFITNGLNRGTYVTLEYIHGGTNPIQVLGDPGNPVACSIDPTTGNLAIATVGDYASGIALYKKATGKPTLYSDSAFTDMWFCGYDDKGNLFVDGDGNTQLAELPKGSKIFTNITLNKSLEIQGGVQWDGSNVAVGDSGAATIYQFRINGSNGTEVGSTPLKGSAVVEQFFVDSNIVLNPSTNPDGPGYVKFYKYPDGGAPTVTLTDVSQPYGAVVSLAK